MNTIIKVQKRTSPYVMVDKSIFENSNISWKAKGLMGYFLSRPNDWQINIKDLYRRGSDGYDSVKSGLRELKKFGYVEHVCTRNEKGSFGSWLYIYMKSPKVWKSLKSNH